MSKLISCHEGHAVCNYKNTLKNDYKVWEDKLGKYIEMYTKNGSFYFDYEDFKYVTTSGENKITWNMQKNKTANNRDAFYVRSNINGTTICLHQYLLGHYGKGSANITVDHIDRNPLNNRRHNLRLASKSEQRFNTSKATRRKDAQPLPEGIPTLPKYVGYTRYKRRNTFIDYFFIKRHPSNIRWQSTSSQDVSAYDKFEQTIAKLNELDNLIIKQHAQIAGTSLES
jgi:hypothetical protein